MKLRRNLNINNTYSSGNLNPFITSDIDTYTILGSKDEINVAKQKNFPTDKCYILLYDKLGYAQTAKLILNVPLKKYIIVTNKPLPRYLALQIGSNNDASILYDVTFNELDEFKDNIDYFSEVVSTGALLIANEDTTINDIIFSAYNMRYILDRFCIVTTDLPTSFKLYHYLHEVLARWQIQLWLSCSDNNEYNIMINQYEKYL